MNEIMKIYLYKLLLFLQIFIFSFCIFNEKIYAAGNTVNDSFNKAKRYLEKAVYFDHRITIYCQAKFDEYKNITLPDGFAFAEHEKRSRRVEWEHAVPAENFGRAFEEWRNGHEQCVNSNGKPFKGRKCAEKINLEYRYMQSDMYNLFPAIGSVNAARKNYQYSMLPDVKYSFGTCEAKLGHNRFEPPNSAKGELSRAALYMNDVYPKYNLSRQQQQLFESWNKMYPVTEWECTRAKRIEKIQKNENAWVKKPCIDKRLW